MRTTIQLIHIGKKKEQLRAIELFLEVPEMWTSFPGNVLGVTGKHIEALQNANPPVEYEPAQKAHLNGQKSSLRPK